MTETLNQEQEQRNEAKKKLRNFLEQDPQRLEDFDKAMSRLSIEEGKIKVSGTVQEGRESGLAVNEIVEKSEIDEYLPNGKLERAIEVVNYYNEVRDLMQAEVTPDAGFLDVLDEGEQTAPAEQVEPEELESQSEGVWYEGLEKDLVRAIRPVHRFEDREKTKKRSQENIDADYREKEAAQQRLGKVWETVAADVVGMSREDRVAYYRKIEDAARLVFENKTVRSGMTKEEAQKLLYEIWVDAPAGEENNTRVIQPGEKRAEVEKTNEPEVTTAAEQIESPTSLSSLDRDIQTILGEIPLKFQISELKELLRRYKDLDQKKLIYQKIDEIEASRGTEGGGNEFGGSGVFNKLEIKENDSENIAWIRKYLVDAVLENPNTSAPELLKKAEATMRDTRGLYQIVIGENLRERLIDEIYARSDLARLVRWWDELKGNMQSGTEPYDLVKNRMERAPIISDLTKKWLGEQTNYATLNENNEPITINLRDQIQDAAKNIYALMAYDTNSEARNLVGPGNKKLNLWGFSDNPNRKEEISRRNISGNIDAGLLAWQLAEAGCWQAEFDSLHPMRRLVRFSDFRLERMYKISAAAVPGGVRLIVEKGLSGLVPKIQNYRSEAEYKAALSRFVETNSNVFKEEGVQFARTELDYSDGRFRSALLRGRYLQEWSGELSNDASRLANLNKTMLTNFQSASVVVDTLATIGGRSKPGDIGAGVLGKLKGSLFVNGVNMGYSGLELGRHVSSTMEEWTKSMLFGNSAANPYVLEENTWPMDQLFRAYLDSVRWDNSSDSGLYVGTGLPKRESIDHNEEFVGWFNNLWKDCMYRIGVDTSVNLERFITRVIGKQLDQRSTPYALSQKYKSANRKWRSLFDVAEWRSGKTRRVKYEVAW